MSTRVLLSTDGTGTQRRHISMRQYITRRSSPPPQQPAHKTSSSSRNSQNRTAVHPRTTLQLHLRRREPPAASFVKVLIVTPLPLLPPTRCPLTSAANDTLPPCRQPVTTPPKTLPLASPEKPSECNPSGAAMQGEATTTTHSDGEAAATGHRWKKASRAENGLQKAELSADAAPGDASRSTFVASCSPTIQTGLLTWMHRLARLKKGTTSRVYGSSTSVLKYNSVAFFTTIT